MEELSHKIRNGTASIGILGLGYVGLPLAMVFSERFRVFGFDKSEEKINQLMEGESYIKDVEERDVRRILNKTFIPTTDKDKLKHCDFLIICVQTPLDELKKPDLSYVKDAASMISGILRKGHFIILESTTYPGTTDEVLIPILERSGLRTGSDFGVAYSPERVDPGNKEYTIKNTPKIVGGFNKECTEIAAKLYESVLTADIIRVRDCKTAEAAKILENIYRDVNIALVNEMALVSEKLGIDVWETIYAASTKPFGFMSFYPGPGVGGHCIPLDPRYMSYKSKRVGYSPRFIELSTEINEYMKIHTVNLASEALKEVNREIPNSRIAVLGIAYKKDVNDTRESPARDIIEEIITRGGEIKIYDPYAGSIKTRYGEFLSEDSLEDTLKGVDCAIFTIDHSEFKEIDPGVMGLMNSPVVVDGKNIFEGEEMEGFIYYGIGKPRR